MLRRPTGALSHHKFIQLSQTMRHPHTMQVDYRGHQPFALPERIQRYYEDLVEYWKWESPNLQDGQSIVCVSQAITWDTGSSQEYNRNKIALELLPTNYFSFLFSNYSLDVPLSDGTTLRKLYEEGAFGMFGEKERGSYPRGSGFNHFQFPTFGNSLGITISVVTADNKLIIAKRSSTKGIARDKGKWLCAVGTQVKRHQVRFLSSASQEPDPSISALQGLHDEMGEAISCDCGEIVCLGLVYREDFHHCELLYETTAQLSAEDLINTWKETKVPDRREFERLEAIDISTPEPLINHLSDQTNVWSPQHAAGALHSLAIRFPKAIASFGLKVE